MTAEDYTVEECYHINVYFPALDNIIEDTEMVFGEKQKEVMHLYRVIPACMKFEDCEWQWHERMEVA